MEQKIQSYFFFSLFAASGILLFYVFKPFLTALVLAAIFAVTFHPAYEYFLRKIKLKSSDTLAALSIVFIILIVIVIPLLFLGFHFISDIQDLYLEVNAGSGGGDIFETFEILIDKFISTISNFLPFINDITFFESISFKGLSNIIFSWFIESWDAILASTFQFALQLFIFFIALYYFLKEGEVFKNKVLALSPMKDIYDNEIIAKLKISIQSTIKGSLTVCIIQSIVATIGFTIFGVPQALLLGITTFFATLFPTLGTSLIFIPVVIYEILVQNNFAAIGLGIWAVLAVGLIDNILYPFLVGKGTRMHPFLLLIAVLGGVSFFGFAGVLFGPILLSLFFALIEIFALIQKRY